MATQRTFSILKPDATRRNLTGAINAKIEGAGLRIVAQKRVHMTKAQAETFYAVHKERPFYGELVAQMSGRARRRPGSRRPTTPIQRYRDVMGATNPGKGGRRHHPQGFRAQHGREFGARVRCARKPAEMEIAQWFTRDEIVG